MSHVEIVGIAGLPEISPGDDLGEMIHAAAIAQGWPLADGFPHEMRAADYDDWVTETTATDGTEEGAISEHK